MINEEVLIMTHPYTPHLFNSLGLTGIGVGAMFERTAMRPACERTAMRPACDRKFREMDGCVNRVRRPVYSIPTSALIY